MSMGKGTGKGEGGCGSCCVVLVRARDALRAKYISSMAASQRDMARDSEGDKCVQEEGEGDKCVEEEEEGDNGMEEEVCVCGGVGDCDCVCVCAGGGGCDWGGKQNCSL